MIDAVVTEEVLVYRLANAALPAFDFKDRFTPGTNPLTAPMAAIAFGTHRSLRGTCRHLSVYDCPTLLGSRLGSGRGNRNCGAGLYRLEKLEA